MQQPGAGFRRKPSAITRISGWLRQGGLKTDIAITVTMTCINCGFLQRARGLGFSVEDCRVLLSLYEDRNRASSDVKEIAKAHLSEIERKISELQSLQKTLSDLVHACHGDDRPHCPIINDLAR